MKIQNQHSALISRSIAKAIYFCFMSSLFLLASCSTKKSKNASSGSESETSESTNDVMELRNMDLRELLNSATFDNKNSPSTYTGKEASLAENGVYETFHSNGKVHQHFTFVNGKAEGEFITNNEYGDITRREHYKNGIASGVWEDYSGGGFGIGSSDVYVDGYLNGPSLRYYTNNEGKGSSSVRTRDTFINGFAHGFHTEYMKDG
jgi:antitoxin component YwqK of YwqJK toxin-antitoxin module